MCELKPNVCKRVAFKKHKFKTHGHYSLVPLDLTVIFNDLLVNKASEK